MLTNLSLFKKYLYLLQLEEYDSSRFLDWLKKYKIENLEERKKKLVFTPRIFLTGILSFFISIFINSKTSIVTANNSVSIFFCLIEEIVVILAKIKLKAHPKLINIIITGSYGKTTFKEKLAFVFSKKFNVLKTPENINTRIGIALTILKNLNKIHEIFVIEAGAYKTSDIKEICEFVSPEFGIITSIGYMHLERFETIENIRSTKMEIAAFVKEKGCLFLPQKDHQMLDFDKTITTIANHLGIDTKQIENSLNDFVEPKHRLSETKLSNQIALLDDSYNSNPLGFAKAIKKLSQFKRHQKIIVTPGMIELGKMQFTLNQQAAELASKIADIFAIVGETNKAALESGIKKSGKRIIVCHIGKNQLFDQIISPFLKPPSVILIENDLPDNYF